MIGRNSGTRLRVLAVVIAASHLATAASSQDYRQIARSRPLTLAAQGSFYVGGETQVVEEKYTGGVNGRAGESMINQMYVQFQKPARRNGQFPIVFVHGCCLSSKTWETTPDGRMGWYEYFTRKGFDTFMADQVGRGRSGFNALRFQKVLNKDAPPETMPLPFIATDQFAWNSFRLGNYAKKQPWADGRFPMKTAGIGPGSNKTFYKQVIPDLSSSLPGAPQGCASGACVPPVASTWWATPVAMAQLADELGGAILVGHSQSSSFPTRAALQRGAKGIKGIIQLETGCFDNLTAAEIAVLKDIPILVMEGDHYVDAQGQPLPKPPLPCRKEMEQIKAAGGSMTYIHLPAMGIHGNSHMFMQDNNSLQIADIVIDWINRSVRPQHGRPRAARVTR